jgi:hypothetical protein
MPLYRFHIESPLDSHEVLERIGNLVRKEPAFWPSLKEAFGWRPSNTPPFIGKVEGNTFRIYRDIRYRNSFLRRNQGRVEASRHGTSVDVKMTLHPAVAIFMIAWIGAGGFGIFGANGDANSKIWLVPAAFVILGFVLTSVCFFPEALKARRILQRSLTGAGPSAGRMA